jgi:uncharacterized PurR-regulated membrane protein YhhQ (DUF165 family)
MVHEFAQRTNIPILTTMNGVDLARMFNQMQSPGYAILIWLVLITAILSIIFTLAHTKDLEKESVIVDWILLGGSISGGLFSLGRMSREYFNLQLGAYVIIAGWILSLIFLIIASCSHTQKGS